MQFVILIMSTDLVVGKHYGIPYPRPVSICKCCEDSVFLRSIVAVTFVRVIILFIFLLSSFLFDIFNTTACN